MKIRNKTAKISKYNPTPIVIILVCVFLCSSPVFADAFLNMSQREIFHGNATRSISVNVTNDFSSRKTFNVILENLPSGWVCYEERYAYIDYHVEITLDAGETGEATFTLRSPDNNSWNQIDIKLQSSFFATLYDEETVDLISDVVPPYIQEINPVVDELAGSITLNVEADDVSAEEENIYGTPDGLLEYSYMRIPGGDNWSDWSNNSAYTYQNIAEGYYVFSVQVRDEAGNVRYQSDARVLYLRCPNGLYFTNNNSGINLNWVDISNAEAGYRIEHRIGSEGAWVVYAENLPANTTTYQCANLDDSNTHAFRIRSLFDNLGLIMESEASEILIYIPSPELVHPRNNSTDVSISQTQFAWNRAPETVSQNIQISTNTSESDFTSGIVYQHDIPNQDETYIIHNILLPNRMYAWRIMASDNNQNIVYSSINTFTTEQMQESIVISLLQPIEDYGPGEEFDLDINLVSSLSNLNISNALVQYDILDVYGTNVASSQQTSDTQGNVTFTLSAPGTPGTYLINIEASKIDYTNGSLEETLNVSSLPGHELSLIAVQTDSYHIDPGGTISFSGALQNTGNTIENVTVLISSISPDGTILNNQSVTSLGEIQPGESISLPSLYWIHDSGPEGAYIVRVVAQSGNAGISNSFGIYVGEPSADDAYTIRNFMTEGSPGDYATASFGGNTFEMVGINPNYDLYSMLINGSSTGEQEAHKSLRRSPTVVYNASLDLSRPGFYAGYRTSNAFLTVEPAQAGQTSQIDITVPGGDYDQIRVFSVSGGSSGFFYDNQGSPSFISAPSSSNGSFSINFTPQSQGTYYFAIEVFDRSWIQSSGSVWTQGPGYLVFGSVDVAPYYDYSVSVSSLTNASVGDIVEINTTINQAGPDPITTSADLNVIITNDESGEICGVFNGSYGAGTPQFNWDTNGLVAGDYTITVSIDNDRDMNSTNNHNETQITLLSPPVLAILTSPANGEIDVDPTEIIFQWEPAQGAESFDFQLDDDSEFQSPDVNVTGILEQTYTVNDLLENTEYFWRVRGVNAAGASYWSQSQYTTLDFIPVLNVNPTVQNLGEEGGTAIFSIQNLGNGLLEWSTESSEGIDWISISGPLTGTNDATISINVTQNYSSARIGLITIEGGDVSGSPFEVSILQSASSPSEFSLTQESGNIATIENDTVMLKWHPSHDPDPEDNIHYVIWWAENQDFTMEVDSSVVQDTLITLTGLTDGAEIWWKVRAQDFNTAGRWSTETYHFEVNIPDAPNPFNLVYPVSGEIIEATEVTLRWNNTTDEDNDEFQFDLEWTNESNYDSPFQVQTSDTFYTLSGLSWGDSILWRVSSVDVTDRRTWGSGTDEGLWFTLHDIPNTFNITGPSVEVVTRDSMLVLNWHPSVDNEPGDLITYSAFWTSDTNSTAFDDTVYTLDTAVTIGPFRDGTELWWGVEARDSFGLSTSSTEYGHAIFTLPNSPQIPRISNLGPDDDSENIQRNQILNWICGDPDGDILTFDVYFGVTNPPPLVKSNWTGQYYDPRENSEMTMEANTTYYWKIIANDGFASSVSPVWSFKTLKEVDILGYSPENIVDDFYGGHDILTTDMDLDGDIDVIAVALHADSIVYWENDGTNIPGDWICHLVDGNFDAVQYVDVADFNNDGNKDILASSFSSGEVSWWENNGSNQTENWNKHEITNSFDGAKDIMSADIDNDGDFDVIGASFDLDEIAIWENVNENYVTTWVKHTVVTDFDGAIVVQSVDLNEDGLLDIVGASNLDDALMWWENDGTLECINWEEKVICTTFGQAFDIDIADLNNDGHQDLLGAAGQPDKLVWWKNLGDGGISWQEIVIELGSTGNENYPEIESADLNGDAHIDVLASYPNNSEIVWWENDGTELVENWQKHIIDQNLTSIYRVDEADFDKDGDLDIIALGQDRGVGIKYFETITSYTYQDFDINIQGQSETGLTDQITAGLNGNATDGYDSSFDIPKPPVPTADYIYIYFPHPEWGLLIGDNFLKDIRGETDLTVNIKTFDFIVQTDQVGSQVNLNFTFTEGIPDNIDLKLYDDTTGEYINLRTNPNYVFEAQSSQSFSLMVGGNTPLTTANEGWHLMSIPSIPNGDGIALEDLVQGDSTVAFLFKHNPGNYYSLIDTVHHGAAYWLAVVDNGPATMCYAGNPLIDDYTAQVDSGWSLVGDPLLRSVPLTELTFTDGSETYGFVEAVNNGWVGTPTVYTLHTWENGTSGYVMSNSLDPWFGYWLLINHPGLTMTVPLENTTPDPIPTSNDYASASLLNSAEWLIPITISNGEWIQHLTAIGCAEDATDGFDPWFDIPALPVPASEGYIDMNSMVAGRTLYQDIRSPLSTDVITSWTYHISGATNVPVTLSFDQIDEQLPEEFEIYLVVDGQEFDLRENSSIVFEESIPSNVEIRVIPTSMNNGIEDSNLPKKFAIESIYPNPFNPTTTVRVALPISGNLRIEIFDLLGKRVSILTSGKHEAGRYSFVFDGSALPSGIYFTRVSLNKEKELVQKMVLIK